MKHYIDIQNIREEDVDLGGGVVRQSNVRGFEVGDQISITVKVDGTNGSFSYDPVTKSLIAFSRKQELDAMKTNQGYWNWVQSLDASEYEDEADYVPFMEWLVSHHVKYEQDAYRQSYVYDVWNKAEEKWMPQSFVKDFCARHHLNYIMVFYEGTFISWEHCRSFLNSHWKALGLEEGVVIRNLSKLDNAENRMPSYIKIVNEKFQETMKQREKTVDPEKVAAKQNAEQLMSTVVTENRVAKEIHKMVDEGILPNDLTPDCMKIVAQNLPKRIWEDCLKEEKEICMVAGEPAGKICSSLTMKFARQIILG